MSKYANIARFLRDELGIKTFVETGILGCETTLWAAKNFERVYGLEIEPNCAKRAKILLEDRLNTTIVQGDSGETLPKLLLSFSEPVLIVLDAHFYGSCTPVAITMEIQCPIDRELQAIADTKIMHSVIIDDMKFFRDRDIPEGADLAQFPTLDGIMGYLGDRAMFVDPEFLIAVPRAYGSATWEFLRSQENGTFHKVQDEGEKS